LARRESAADQDVNVEYIARYKPRAEKSLRKLPRGIAERVLEGIARMQADLQGDVKRLTSHEPAYRLRVGDYRVLFDVEGSTLIIQDVIHRKNAY
jgi:mRNA interferase RelE/StbE